MERGEKKPNFFFNYFMEMIVWPKLLTMPSVSYHFGRDETLLLILRHIWIEFKIEISTEVNFRSVCFEMAQNFERKL